MPTVHANGCDFAYELTGQGPDVVFIHGEIHGMEYWEHQLPAFSHRYRCLAYNRRGHAGTQWTEYGFSLVNQTRDLGAILEALGMQRPVIVSLAFGTTIAAQYAIQHPDRVSGLVLGAWSELHDALQYFHRWAAYNARSAAVLEEQGRQALEELLRREGGISLYRVIPVDSPVREKVIRMFASHPVGEYRRGMLEFGLSVPDLVPALRELRIPALGICGADDPYPDQPALLQGMANFREAPSVPGAGRFVHWEKPDAFNAAVLAFLDQCHRP
jgi:pimeloyl-ACP methyl ester carboxylesterase